MQPLGCSREPRPQAISSPVVRTHQEYLSGLDQQCAQLFAASLKDAIKDRAPARAVLPCDEAQPGGKIAPALKSLACGDRGYHAGPDQRSDPLEHSSTAGTWPR